MASEGNPETTSADPKVERDIAAEALNHLVQGKRHLLVQDIPSAVASLQEACKLVVECHGEMANECGETYFYYGKALLELARDEAGVFGTVLDDGKGKEEDEDENGKDENEESEDEDDQSDESEEASNGDKETEKEASTSSTAVDSNLEKNSKDLAEPSSSKDVAVQPDSEDIKKEEDSDEVTNLQLAWETLELAKIIFKRQSEGNREILLKLAAVHLHLGEVGLESENYQQAVEDMQRCLAIREDLLCQNDRLLAETHYQLGLALCFDNFYDDAIKHFQSAVGVMRDRITGLKAKLKSKNEDKTIQDEPAKNEESVESIQREIEDLEEILPEIEEKVTDTEDMKRNTAQKLREAAFNTGLLSIKEEPEPEQLLETTSFAGSSSVKDAKPIANISHLVKRKRKPEEDNAAATTQLEKKPRSDILESSNVSSSAQELPTSQNKLKSSVDDVQSCATKSNDLTRLSSASNTLEKNDSDVSSTTSFPPEEKKCHIAMVDNEATEAICPSTTSKGMVVESELNRDSTGGQTLANGDGSEKVVAARTTQENVEIASSN